MEISLLLSFFFLSDKSDKERREKGGMKHKCLRVLAGFSASKQKQNGSVNKKAITNARLGHEAVGVAGVETALAFFGEPWSFVRPCVTLRSFPSRNVLPC